MKLLKKYWKFMVMLIVSSVLLYVDPTPHKQAWWTLALMGVVFEIYLGLLRLDDFYEGCLTLAVIFGLVAPWVW